VVNGAYRNTGSLAIFIRIFLEHVMVTNGMIIFFPFAYSRNLPLKQQGAQSAFIRQTAPLVLRIGPPSRRDPTLIRSPWPTDRGKQSIYPIVIQRFALETDLFIQMI
jgi:hypothetical protein